jgi:hypothetical protein
MFTIAMLKCKGHGYESHLRSRNRCAGVTFRIISELGKGRIYECKTLSSSKMNYNSLFFNHLTFSISKNSQHQITECERKPL